MTLRPYTVTRYGLYAALAVSALSVWMGHQAGASIDYTLMRGVLVFIVFAVIAVTAEAIVSAPIPVQAEAPVDTFGHRPKSSDNAEAPDTPASTTNDTDIDQAAA